MFAENLDVFLQDMGLPVVVGAYSCTGLLDQPDDMLSAGGSGHAISTMYELTLKTSDVVAGAIASGIALTVAGVGYVVRDVLLEGDGAFSKLSLTKS